MRQMNLVAFLLAWVFCGTGESATFKCAGGDVDCLIAAINTSNGNGEANTIRLEPGTYSLTDVNNVGPPSNSPNGLPVIVGAVTIVGVAAEATIIERGVSPIGGLPRFRIFRVASTGTLVLDGVTVRGGYPGFPFTGGALLSNGTVTITRSVVRQNLAGACGAIHAEGNGLLTIRDSRIVENSVEIGGEILCVVGFLTRAAVSVVIDRTSVSDNSPREGHAITISTSAAAIISGSTVSNNRTGGIGGAIAASGDVTIVNSTIANNRAGFSGSAVHAQGTGVQILNSTITNNVLGFLGRSTGVDGPAALRNTIVAGNLDDGEPADCAGIVSLGHNLIGDPGTCTLLASDLSGDPGLAGFVDTGRPGGGVVRLLSDSQAIDAGDDTECPATDQQGLARPIDGDGDGIRACDIGATEFYPVVNDLVELNVGSRYRPPSPRDAANPLTAGGEFRITATLTNLDARDICSVAFEVVTLEGEGSASPLLLTRRGDVIGGEGSIVPATLFNAKPDLDAAKHARYSFRIGLSQMEEITFLVNVLGEVTAGPCVK